MSGQQWAASTRFDRSSSRLDRERDDTQLYGVWCNLVDGGCSLPTVALNKKKTLDWATFEKALNSNAELNLFPEERRRIWQALAGMRRENLSYERFRQTAARVQFLRNILTNMAERKLLTHFKIPDDYDYGKSTMENYALKYASDLEVAGEPVRSGVVDQRTSSAGSTSSSSSAPAPPPPEAAPAVASEDTNNAGTARSSSSNSAAGTSTHQSRLLTAPEKLAAQVERSIFGAIRQKMDYGYHGYYTPNRLQWQDELIKHVVTKNRIMGPALTEPIHRPWLIYSCGAMGAGKGHVMRWLTAQNFIPMEKAVRIDPDVFKAVMPEFDGYVGIDKFRSGTYCHTESGAIQEIALEASLRMSQNIWVDGSLRNTEWYREQIQDVRDRFPQYRIAIFYVYCSLDILLLRVRQRGEETGRFIPEETLQESILGSERSVLQLTPLVDVVGRVRNETRPELEALMKIDRSHDFTRVGNLFSRDLGVGHDHLRTPFSLHGLRKTGVLSNLVLVPYEFFGGAGEDEDSTGRDELAGASQGPLSGEEFAQRQSDFLDEVLSVDRSTNLLGFLNAQLVCISPVTPMPLSRAGPVGQHGSGEEAGAADPASQMSYTYQSLVGGPRSRSTMSLESSKRLSSGSRPSSYVLTAFVSAFSATVPGGRATQGAPSDALLVHDGGKESVVGELGRTTRSPGRTSAAEAVAAPAGAPKSKSGGETTLMRGGTEGEGAPGREDNRQESSDDRTSSRFSQGDNSARHYMRAVFACRTTALEKWWAQMLHLHTSARASCVRRGGSTALAAEGAVLEPDRRTRDRTRMTMTAADRQTAVPAPRGPTTAWGAELPQPSAANAPSSSSAAPPGAISSGAPSGGAGRPSAEFETPSPSSQLPVSAGTSGQEQDHDEALKERVSSWRGFGSDLSARRMHLHRTRFGTLGFQRTFSQEPRMLNTRSELASQRTLESRNYPDESNYQSLDAEVAQGAEELNAVEPRSTTSTATLQPALEVVQRVTGYGEVFTGSKSGGAEASSTSTAPPALGEVFGFLAFREQGSSSGPAAPSQMGTTRTSITTSSPSLLLELHTFEAVAKPPAKDGSLYLPAQLVPGVGAVEPRRSLSSAAAVPLARRRSDEQNEMKVDGEQAAPQLEPQAPGASTTSAQQEQALPPPAPPPVGAGRPNLSSLQSTPNLMRRRTSTEDLSGLSDGSRSPAGPIADPQRFLVAPERGDLRFGKWELLRPDAVRAHDLLVRAIETEHRLVLQQSAFFAEILKECGSCGPMLGGRVGAMDLKGPPAPDENHVVGIGFVLPGEHFGVDAEGGATGMCGGFLFKVDASSSSTGRGGGRGGDGAGPAERSPSPLAAGVLGASSGSCAVPAGSESQHAVSRQGTRATTGRTATYYFLPCEDNPTFFAV